MKVLISEVDDLLAEGHDTAKEFKAIDGDSNKRDYVISKLTETSLTPLIRNRAFLIV